MIRKSTWNELHLSGDPNNRKKDALQAKGESSHEQGEKKCMVLKAGLSGKPEWLKPGMSAETRETWGTRGEAL